MVSARMKSAKQVGGDFYDSFLLKNGNICTVIGDVSGKGVAASLFMVFVKTLIREKLIDISDASDAIKSANLEICESNPEEMFVTAFIAIFDSESDKFHYINAGHNKPVIIKTERQNFLNAHLVWHLECLMILNISSVFAISQMGIFSIFILTV